MSQHKDSNKSVFERQMFNARPLIQCGTGSKQRVVSNASSYPIPHSENMIELENKMVRGTVVSNSGCDCSGAPSDGGYTLFTPGTSAQYGPVSTSQAYELCGISSI